jgi:predicted small secreted protein
MIMTFKRIVLLFCSMALLALVNLSCNTAHGFGKDLEKAGDKIQDGTK